MSYDRAFLFYVQTSAVHTKEYVRVHTFPRLNFININILLTIYNGLLRYINR